MADRMVTVRVFLHMSPDVEDGAFDLPEEPQVFAIPLKNDAPEGEEPYTRFVVSDYIPDPEPVEFLFDDPDGMMCYQTYLKGESTQYVRHLVFDYWENNHFVVKQLALLHSQFDNSDSTDIHLYAEAKCTDAARIDMLFNDGRLYKRVYGEYLPNYVYDGDTSSWVMHPDLRYFTIIPDAYGLAMEGNIHVGWTSDNGIAHIRRGSAWIPTSDIENEYWSDEDNVLIVPVKAEYRPYDLEHTPLAKIEVYRENGLGPYADLTWSQVTAPTIRRVENQAGSATFSVVNKWDGDESKIYISDNFNGWSDGATAPITCGMHIVISNYYDANGSRWPVFIGIISDIQLNGDIITFTCADAMARLDKAGTDLRRNYRTPETIGWFNAQYSGDNEGRIDKIWAVLDDTAADGGLVTPLSYGWAVTDTNVTASDSHSWGFDCHDDTGKTFLTFTHDFGGYFRLESISLKLWGNFTQVNRVDNIRLTMSLDNGQDIFTSESVVSINYHSDTYVKFGFFRPINGPVTISVKLSSTHNNITRGEGVDVYYAPDLNGDMTLNPQLPDYSVIGKYCPTMTYEVDRLEMSPRGKWVVENNRNVFYVDTTDESYVHPTTVSRLYVVYSKENVNISDIMDHMCDFMGYTYDYLSNLPTTSSNLAAFRAGSGFIGDYLRKLCDVHTDDGRARSFIAFGTGPGVYVGTRYTAQDDPLFAIAYGGEDMDSHDVPTSVLKTFRFSNFAPNKTLKHRANKVTYFANVNDGSSEFTLPITIIDRARGATRAGKVIEAMADGSTASWLEGVQGAWSNLTSNSIDQWEGTITLPMSLDVRRFMPEFVTDHNSELLYGDSTHVGSGVPVVIYDRRYGFNGLRAKVKEVEMNYSACTVTLTLNNYSMQYSSDVSDSIAQTIKMGASNGAEESALWSRQYVYLNVDVDPNRENCSLQPGAEMWITSKEGTNSGDYLPSDKIYADVGSTRWYQLPTEGKEYIAVAKFTANSANQINEMYGIKVIGFTENDGSDHTIRVPEYRRPDFQVGQTLVVCLQLRWAEP